MVKIEKGVPLPSPRASNGRTAWSWVKRLKIGDSVLMPFNQKRVASAISRAAKNANVRVTTRKVEGGTRVWRIE